jgi:hypothetical protein
MSIKDLRKILYSIRNIEEHDWFEGLAAAAKLSRDQLHMILFKAWISKPENEKLAETAFFVLMNLVEPTDVKK